MAESMERTRYTVGYALAPKKQASFIQDSFVKTAAEKGIDLVKIDREKALVDQGPFDCILHKLYSDEWKQQLRDFSAKNPSSLIIDSPEAIERLHNRISMLQVVTELKLGDGGDEQDSEMENDESFFGIPKQTVIYDSDSVSEVNLKELGLKFPVIAKPLVADGSAKSHKMLLVYNSDGLGKLKPPIVLQEFINHGGVIFKVYVVGDHVKCVKRKSLPDVNEESLGSLEGSLSFSQVSNLNAQDKIDDQYYKTLQLENVELPPISLITEIARGLRKETKLHLFNFDLIRDNKVGNRYLVVDINYFPGYAKMPDYECAVTDFFWNVLSKRNGTFEDLKVDAAEVGSHGHGEDEGALTVSSTLEREEKEHSLQV